MIHSRRGLSDIVTNVLIILLVLVAVGIIWYFVQPFIRGGAKGIEGAQDCLTVDAVPITCLVDAGGSQYNVTVNRNSGSGGLQGFKLVFADNAGNTKVISQASGISEYESAKFSVPMTSVFGTSPSGTVTLKIAAVVTLTDDPAGKTCEIRPAQVNCA